MPDTRPIISLIAAMSANRVIGRDGQLPWHLPADLKRFKRLTTGHAVIMGRKTFDSIEKPLPKRFNVVLSRRDDLAIDGAVVCKTLDDAIEAIGRQSDYDTGEVFIVGGAEIYQLAMPRADRLYLTILHRQVEGDTFFPDWPDDAFRVARREVHDEPESFEYVDYHRIETNGSA